jgi:hypothetical protein
MSNGGTPQSPIPAIGGTCPDGYIYDPTSDQCFFVTPPVSVTSTGVSLPDVDPKNAGELAGLGTQDSGLPERAALAHWQAIRRLARTDSPSLANTLWDRGTWLDDVIASMVAWFVDKYDRVVAFGVDFIGSSATRNQPGFWILIGTLISDLLGVQVDGARIYNDMQSRGTLAAMQDVGTSLINLLVGEFTGTAGGSGGNITFSSAVNPDTSLPAATLTPAGGVKAAQALMGFVLSSAVRQGNIDAISGQIEGCPWPINLLAGHAEKFSEAMRTNLGIGRMLRFALRPIFQDLVAGPLKWAVNKQYRPKLFVAAEAARAFLRGDIDRPAYMEETALDGYSDARANALLAQHTVQPQVKELLTLRGAGVMSDNVFDGWLARHGYDDAGKQWTRQASDLEPARRVALALAEHYLLEFGKGQITAQGLKDFIDGLKLAGFLLTPGEIQGLEAITQAIVSNTKLRIRHLQPGQAQRAFIDGTITLDEYEQHLRDLGYQEPDVQTLGIEALIALRKAQAAAAKHAAAGKKGSGPATSPTLAPSTGTTPTIP